MPNDKSDRGRYPVLSSLREMLGLQGDTFISAMKEAVWVPGGVDQLADIIIQSLSIEDQYRLAQELPDEPEVMALIGRLLIALNDHPKRQELGASVIKRAEKLGERATRFLSPYNWYPPVDQIRTILVSPYRLHGASIMMRMQWGGDFEGIEAVWMVRFAAGDLGEVYFLAEDTDKGPLNEMKWMEISMDQALSLITSVAMLQSSVNNGFPFDGMAGVGLWMVLAGDREVAPWIDAAYALEVDRLSAEETALAEMNAVSAGDYLAAYDLMDVCARPDDILEYIANKVEEAKTQGELWRLDASTALDTEKGTQVNVRAWYRTDSEIVDRSYLVRLGEDANGYWRITGLEQLAEEGLGETEVEQYLAHHPQYYAELEVVDMEEMADAMSEPPHGQTSNAVHFSAGPEFDYRQPYDLGRSRDMHWTVTMGDDLAVLVWASNELSLRREVARLQEEGAAGSVIRTGVMDILMLDRVQDAADQGAEPVRILLDSLDVK